MTRSHRVTTGLVPMEAKVALILEKLSENARVEFKELLDPLQDKMHGVMTLLASLELSKQRAVTLRQSRLFSELWLLRRDLAAWSQELPADPRKTSTEVEDDA